MTTSIGPRYRRHEDPPVGIVGRLWPVARGEALLLTRTRLGLLALFVAALPLLTQLVLLLIQVGVVAIPRGHRIVNRIASMGWMNIGHPEFYAVPLQRTSLMFFLVPAALVLCRAIAKDRQTNALELFWTRPITPFSYFVAKWLGGAGLVASFWVLGPAVLWLVAVAFGPDDYASSSYFMVSRVLLAGIWSSLAASFLAVGISATTASANMSSILFVGLSVGMKAVSTFLARLFRGEQWPRALSPWDAIAGVGEALAGVSPGRGLPLTGCLIVLGVLYGALVWSVSRQLRIDRVV